MASEAENKLNIVKLKLFILSQTLKSPKRSFSGFTVFGSPKLAKIEGLNEITLFGAQFYFLLVLFIGYLKHLLCIQCCDQVFHVVVMVTKSSIDA
jgi:hypothetical protein